MRFLILSDIHANWDALQSVLAAVDGQYDRILCCGDLVGYGPEPNRVVEWAQREVHAVIRGNHDRACCGLDDLEDFTPLARAGSVWTIGRLSRESIEWLVGLPAGPLSVDGLTLVHGSPADEDEYIVSPRDASAVHRDLTGGVTFFGHTHLQGGYFWRGGGQRLIPGPGARETVFEVPIDGDGLYLINPGSVGQPRDGDPRAAWALYDSLKSTLQLGRTAYDCGLTGEKILEAGLPPALAYRLTVGK